VGDDTVDENEVPVAEAIRPFELTDRPIDAASLRAELDSASAGGVVVFEGVVRNHHQGRAVLRLAYQAYEALAAREGQRILDEAREQHAIERVVCVHRVGELAIGEVAVFVGVAAAHRDAAFAACRYVIDETKRRVPIWKKEFYATGESDWLHP
jgi:molybdopterin synthase catalytic subunit